MSDLERSSQHIPASRCLVVSIQGRLVELCNELLHPAFSSHSPLNAKPGQAMWYMFFKHSETSNRKLENGCDRCVCPPQQDICNGGTAPYIPRQHELK